jgi:hypothetical protein
MVKSICVLLTVVALAACGTTRPAPVTGRPVMSQHHEWTIRITPWSTGPGKAVRARVEVWPPDRSPQMHSGIQVHFTESRPDEPAIVQAALASARRYIDASRSEHR